MHIFGQISIYFLKIQYLGIYFKLLHKSFFIFASYIIRKKITAK